MALSYFQSHITLVLLTLNMLSCFEDHQICIHISYNILNFVQQKKTSFTEEEPIMLPILYWQYHASWCSDDFRSQGINENAIDPQSRNIPPSGSEDLTLWMEKLNSPGGLGPIFTAKILRKRHWISMAIEQILVHLLNKIDHRSSSSSKLITFHAGILNTFTFSQFWTR